MLKRLSMCAGLFLLAAFFISGCAAVSSAGQERPPLRVEYTTWEGDYTLLIAEEKGFFTRHGVEVEPVFYETFSAAIPDLAAKQVDGGLFGIGDLLTVAHIVDVKGVVVYDSGGTSTVVARPEIETIADLRGEKIGVSPGTSGELIVREMLSSADVSMHDVSLVSVDPEMVLERLSEDISAGYVWAPYDKKAVSAGNKILYSRSESNALFPDVIVFHGEIVKQRPEDIRAFVAAWFDALEYRLANPQESNEIIARLTNQNAADIASDGTLKLYNREDNLRLFDQSDTNPSSIYSTAKANLNFLITRGNVTISPRLDDILDPSFLP